MKKQIQKQIRFVSLCLLLFSGMQTAWAANHFIAAGGDSTAAINAALTSAVIGDHIVLRSGTHNLSSQILVFQRENLVIRGETGNPDDIIIDVQGADRAFKLRNSPSVVLRDLTIRNGVAISRPDEDDLHGGAVYIFEGGQVENCIIENSTANFGGGVRIRGGGSVRNSIFRNNSANVSGGGAQVAFVGEITNSDFYQNTAAEKGGGIYAFQGGTVSGNRLWHNQANFGGGIRLYRDASAPSTPLADGNLVYSNTAVTATFAGEGGGIQTVGGTVQNCVIHDNISEGNGGGVSMRGGLLVNNTIAHNNTQNGGIGGGIWTLGGSVRNSMIYFNQANSSELSLDANRNSNDGTVSYTHNLTTPIIFGGGNISGIPQFVDVASRNYRLLGDSPGIDEGSNTGAPNVDFDGNPRPRRGLFVSTAAIADMGAFEYELELADFSGSLDYEGWLSTNVAVYNPSLYDDQASMWMRVDAQGTTLAERELSGPGTYAFTNMPLGVSLDITVYQDWNNNNSQDTWEPVGVYSNNPLVLSADTNGIDITLQDSSTDTTGDGLRDFEEVFWYGTDLNLVDTDGDTFPDYDEIFVWNTVPIDSASFPAELSGAITYQGQLVTNGNVIVRVLEAGTTNVVRQTTLSQPDPYTIVGVPTLFSYDIIAFQDLAGDGEPTRWEPYGLYTNSPLLVTTNLTGIDIILTDPDTDHDGLTDYQEGFVYGTDPDNPDSSGDGVADGWLVHFGLDPTNNWATNIVGTADMTVFEKFDYSNRRLAPDTYPTNGLYFAPTNGLNPLLADTDGDDMPDSWEVAFAPNPLTHDEFSTGLDPLDLSDAGIDWTQQQSFIAAETNYVHATIEDPDGDGLSNLTEYQYSLATLGAGFVPSAGLSPLLADTDEDVMPDGWEVYFNLDPLDISDAGITWTQHRLNVLQETPITNTIAQDPDFDGVSNLAEYQFSLAYHGGTSLDPTVGLDPRDIDSDEDSMPDGTEIFYWITAPQGISPTDPLVDDADADPDGDGLSNGDEVTRVGTSPVNPDTDGDGASDGIEDNVGTDPLDENSFPVSITGSLTYTSGIQPGSFLLIATNISTNVVATYTSVTATAGVYVMDPVPNNETYNIFAYKDTNTNGVYDGWEAYGAYVDTNDMPIAVVASNAVVSGVNISLVDPDGDGDRLSDYEELFVYFSNPAVPDTSGDTVSDGWLAHFGLSPTNDWTGVTLTSNDMSVVDKYVYSLANAGTNYFVFDDGLDPREPDNDTDGILDGWEVFFGLDPLDGTDAGISLVGQQDLWDQSLTQSHTASQDPDTDGLSNRTEYEYSTSRLGFGFTPTNGLSPVTNDTDGDAMLDAWEVLQWYLAGTNTSPVDPILADAAADPDSDGLTNLGEYQEGTDPGVADTDGDGALDGFEVQWGSDPLDLASYPIRFTGAIENLTSAPVLTGVVQVAMMTVSGVTDVVVGTFPAGPIGPSGTVSNVDVAYVPNQTPYWVRAYIDLDTNGVWTPSDPFGTFGDSGNMVTPVNDTTFGTISIANSAEDSDGDGLTDYEETYIHETDPLDPDSDNDGFDDQEEITLGTDPNDNISFPASISGFVSYTNVIRVAGDLFVVATNAAGGSWAFNLGTYDDGAFATPTNVPTLTNYWVEAFIDTNTNGVRDSWEPSGVPLANPIPVFGNVAGVNITISNPSTDSDSDGLTDFEEDSIHGTDPFIADTDLDGFNDGVEVSVGSDPLDSNSYPIVVSGTVTYMGPQTGTVYWVADYGTNAIFNVLPISETSTNISYNYTVTNVVSARNYTIYAFRDSSGDGMTNAWEATGFFAGNPVLAPSNAQANIDIVLLDPGAGVDSDLDGIDDFDEVYDWRSDPLNPDTSGDGVPDGWLAHFGLSPTNNWSGVTNSPADMAVTAKYAYSESALAPGTDILVDGLAFAPTNGLDPNILDTDGDTHGDGFEITWQSDPLDLNSFPVTIDGTIWNFATNSYATLGPLSATAYIVFNYESNANFFTQIAVTNAVITNAGPASLTGFTVSYVPTLSNYWVSAYIDLDGDGQQQAWDPVGYALGGTNFITPSGDMSVGTIVVNDSTVDRDSDGLTDFDETYIWLTSTTNANSDGDGYTDYEEVITYGTDPNDAASFPASLSGTVTYNESTNLVTGNLVILATNTSGGSWIFDLGPFSEGTYQTPTNIPTLDDYYITAFIDSETNGVLETWKPQGQPSVNPVFLNGNLTGIDIVIGHDGLDSDLDGVSDFDEVNIWGSDPLDPDTSGDGVADGWLTYFGLTPTNDWTGVTITNTDMNVVSNYQYSVNRFAPGSNVTNGLAFAPGDGLDPTALDTDQDDLSDNDEINVWGSDPLNPDTSGDTIPDGWLAYFMLDPTINHTVLNPDNDGLTTRLEYEWSQAELDTGSGFDPADGLDPTNPDTDGDTLTDGDEVNIHGTNPLLVDTDADGFTDAEEVLDIESDPLNEFDPIVVDDDHPDDPGPGNPNLSNPSENGSQAFPYDSIQKGIDSAVNGITVYVLDGLYQNTGNNNVNLQGKAIRVRSANGFNSTALRTDTFNCFIVNSGEGTNSIIEGFTIQTSVSGGARAGILVDGSSPTLRNNRYVDCGQAGVLVRNGGNPLIIDSLFENNQGGIKVIESSPRIERCILRFNGDTRGGGISIEGGVSVISSPVIVNSVIVQNSATNFGGGLYVGTNTAPVVLHTTLADNQAGVQGGGLYYEGDIRMWNSILWGNTAPSDPGFGFDSTSDPDTRSFEMAYSLSQTARPAAIEVSTDPPQFVGGVNYSLQSSSPAIDYGTGSLPPDLAALVSIPTEDVALNARPEFLGGRFPGLDAGAYEFISGGSIAILSPGGTPGETLIGGLPQEIRWTYSDDGSVGTNLLLEYTYNFLTDPAIVWNVGSSNVFTGTGGTGTYHWVVPPVEADRLFVRLTDATNALITAVSQLEVEVRDGLRMEEPAGGIYYLGDTVTVHWASSPVTNTQVTLHYAADGVNFSAASGLLVTNVAHVADGSTNSFDWVLPTTAPGFLSDTGRVQVSSGDLVSDTHDAALSVHGIVITQPADNASVVTGANVTVRWESLGAGTNVNLAYSSDGGSIYNSVITNFANLDGTNEYVWSVPTTIASQSVLRVSSVTNLQVVATSGIFVVTDSVTGASLQGDGIPDTWRVTYGLDPENQDGVSGAWDDADADGMSNYEEWLAGTSPTDAGSLLAIVTQSIVDSGVTAPAGYAAQGGTGADFMITWQTVPGKRYGVIAADHLGAPWVLVSDVMMADSNLMSWTDTSGGAVHRFYRVILIAD